MWSHVLPLQKQNFGIFFPFLSYNAFQIETGKKPVGGNWKHWNWQVYKPKNKTIHWIYCKAVGEEGKVMHNLINWVPGVSMETIWQKCVTIHPYLVTAHWPPPNAPHLCATHFLCINIPLIEDTGPVKEQERVFQDGLVNDCIHWGYEVNVYTNKPIYLVQQHRI